MQAVMAEPQPIVALVQRAQRGDREAFDALVARCGARLEAFIGRRIRPALRGRLDLSALAGDTFARAFESLGTFRGSDDDAWHGWLAGIAKKVVLKEIDLLKRSRTANVEPEIAVAPVSPSRALRREERLDRLSGALAALSTDHRDVIRLCRIDGRSVRETARRMGRSPDAVKMLLWRALRELKARFGDTESLHLPDRPIEPEGGPPDAR